MKPASSFRSRYAYDNLLYVAAGQIIPAVTGKSWDEFVRERIFDPLGMTGRRATTPSSWTATTTPGRTRSSGRRGLEPMRSRHGARKRRPRRLDHVERLRHGAVGRAAARPGQGSRGRPAALQRGGIARDVVGRRRSSRSASNPAPLRDAPAEVLELRPRLVPARLSRAEARRAHGRRARLLSRA